jgi:hypothetical protein
MCFSSIFVLIVSSSLKLVRKEKYFEDDNVQKNDSNNANCNLYKDFDNFSNDFLKN